MADDVMARIAALESQVVDVRIAHGKTQVKLDQLDPTIAELTRCVHELQSSIDKGRGAIWMVGSLGVLVGLAGEWVGGHFFK